MNKTSLFKKTDICRESSINAQVHPFRGQRPWTGTQNGNGIKRMRSQFSEQASNTHVLQLLDSSFSSNFPFCQLKEHGKNLNKEVKPFDNN